MTNGKAQAKDHAWQEQSFQINYFILCALLFLINLVFSSAFQQLLLASSPLLPSCWEQKPLCSITLLTQAERPFVDIHKALSFSSSNPPDCLIVVPQVLNSQLCSPLWSHFTESPSQKRAINQL